MAGAAAADSIRRMGETLWGDGVPENELCSPTDSCDVTTRARGEEKSSAFRVARVGCARAPGEEDVMYAAV